MKKSIFILWLAILLVFCFGLSYIVNVNENTYLPPADFGLVVALCGSLVFLLIGIITWAVYFILKKRQSTHAAKTAMIAFTALAIGTMGTTSAKFPENMRNRNEYLHLHMLREKYIRFCAQEIKSHPSMNGIDSTGEKTTDFCYCVFDKMLDDDVQRELLLGVDDPKDLPGNDQTEKLKQDCYDEYFGN